jgi:chromosomal replication initiator protein
MPKRDPKEVWRTTLAQIEVKLDSPAQFKTFFQGATLLDIENGIAKVGVQNVYVHDWLRKRYQNLLESTISHVFGEDLNVELSIHQEENELTEAQLEINEATSPLLAVKDGLHNSVRDILQKAGLNQKYSLGSFVVGDSNRIAHAAALGVIETPGGLYNPLFVHGKTGVGKTHLVQSIARAVLEREPSKRVVYISSEGFLNEMVKGIKTNRMNEFRSKYRAINMLIIDDIQLISKWVSTQAEFFNAFNELHNANSQVILVSDRPPVEIQDLEDRLRSRFQGGMVVDISQPDFELRLAILTTKASQLGIYLSDRIMECIARSVIDNVRELEGALQKVALFNQMKPGGDLTLEEVEKIVGADTKSKQEKIKVPAILKTVGRSFGVTAKDIRGERRTKDVALARQVAMYVLRDEFGYKLEEVAKFVNRTDHTTVMHGVEKIKAKVLTSDGFKQVIVEVVRQLNEMPLSQQS